MKVLTLVLAGTLLLSVFAMLPRANQAEAQTSGIGGVEHSIGIICADGTTVYPGVTFLPFTLTGSVCSESNPIVSLIFKTRVQFYTNDYELTDVSITAPTIKVLARDGTYKTVTGSGGEFMEREFPPSNAIWRIYQVQVLVSTIESAIGTGTEDYTGEIRVTSPAFSFTARHLPSGSTQTYPVTSATTFWNSITQIGSGGCVGSGCVEQPSGNIFDEYKILAQNGTVVYSSGSLDIKPFTLTDLYIVDPVLYPGQVYKIQYRLQVYLDNDIFIMPNTLTFASPGATDNFWVRVNDKNIANDYKVIIQRDYNAFYILLEITADRSAIENALNLTGIPSGDKEQLAGDIKFYVRPSTLKLRDSAGNNFDIVIPERTLLLHLSGYRLIGDDIDPSCQIVNGQSICLDDILETIKQYWLQLLGISTIAAAIGVAVIKRKKLMKAKH